MDKKKLLGEILVERGIITEKTLERTLARARRFDKRLGTLLEETELITGEELADALAVQYGYKVVTGFAEHPFSKELLNLVPVDVAMENLLFPLKIEGDRLALAMADPTETRIVTNIGVNNGVRIVPFIAERKELKTAICRHYLGKTFSAPHDQTVLIIDDDNLLCTMLSNILSKEGYRVVTATDGMEGYRLALSEAPQVIVVDKMLPKLDGYSVFDAFKNVPETRLIPVILMTGSTDVEEESRAFAKGFFDFIQKPVKEVTLRTRVKKAMQFFEREYGL